MPHVETYETAEWGQKRPIGGVKIERYQKTVKVDDKDDKTYKNNIFYFFDIFKFWLHIAKTLKKKKYG